jgi:hypothetical protein
MTLNDLPLQILSLICANLIYYELFVTERSDDKHKEDDDIVEAGIGEAGIQFDGVEDAKFK